MTGPREGRPESGKAGAEARSDGGFSTAEIAVALPGLVIVLVLAAVLLGVLLDQIRCVDAARVAARSVARGDPVSVAKRHASEAAPEGASITVSSGSPVKVVVVGPERALTGGPLRARAAATAPNESVGVTGRRLGSLPLGPVVDPAALPAPTS